MRRYYLLALLLVFLTVSYFHMDTSYLYAPELFDYGVLYSFRMRDVSYGIVHGWGWFAMLTSPDACVIYPLLPSVIDAREPIKCGMFPNANGTIFRGFVEFRGGPHKFCGAMKLINLPNSCLEIDL